MLPPRSNTILIDKGQIDTAGIIRFYGELGVSGIEITGDYVRDGELSAVRQALGKPGSPSPATTWFTPS